MIETQVEKTINIDETIIHETIQQQANPSPMRVRSVLTKAAKMQGLEPDEAATLMAVENPELLDELFRTAQEVKETIYGKRLVIFAPLYVSNLCANECTYCAFRAKNTSLKRRVLTQQEIAQETKVLIEQGHKRVLLVAGETYPQEGFQYVLRRINVNVAPLTVEEFRQLKARGIGTYQIFQETYHHDTYHKVHLAGKKKNYDWRITAMDRAMDAGIDDVGIGVLFGLYDWKFEVLAMLQHIRHLPHTISVPRMEPATGSDIASAPPFPVSDSDFKKLVAILRLTVPYTGIIMSTRETAEMRRATFELGVSQISAGSRTNPGGYEEDEYDASQFSLGDHRDLDDVIRDVAEKGYIPSFCTGCYRLGRTGQDFMDLAKPGDIKAHCDPNGLSTFQEYLEDYASPETRAIGEAAIRAALSDMRDGNRARAEKLVGLVKQGKRDVYC